MKSLLWSPLRRTRIMLKGVKGRLMRLSAVRAVVLVAALFLLLLTAGDAVLLWLQHERTLDEATQDAANLTTVLEQNARQNLEHLDGLLHNLMFVAGEQAAAAGQESLYAFVFRPTTLVDDLRIYGPQGSLIMAAGPRDPAARDWSSQESFVYHRDHPGSGPFVGRPLVEGGKRRFPFSRRIDSAAGEFRGIAVVMVNLDAFSSFFRFINLGPHGSVAIIRRDGMVIARNPPVSGPDGVSVAKSPIFIRQISPLAEGMVSGTSSIDGVMRFGHFRSVAGLPLVVVAFMDREDALRSWNTLVEQHVVILGAVALAVIFLVTLIARQQSGLAQAASAVREEQHRVEAITANLPAVLMQRTLDPDGTVKFPYISPGLETMLGVTREQFVADPDAVFKNIPAADGRALRRAFRVSSTKLTDISEDFRFMAPGGAVHWLRFTARPRRLESGTIVWEGLFSNVTAQKAAVADKLALERRLEATVDKVPGVVFQRVQAPDGQVRYTYVSPAVLPMFGVSPQEVLRDATRLIQRVVPEDQEGMSLSFMRQPADRKEWNQEFQVRGGDGQLRWMRGTAGRHTTDAGDVVWDGIFLDITTQKAAVAATRALQRRLEAVVANIPGAVFECVQSREGFRFSFLSPQAQQIFGVPVREMLHDFDRIKTHILPEDRPALDARLAQFREDAEEWIDEFRVQPPGEALHWVRGTAKARRQEDGLLMWNGVFQDVTHSKAAEEQAQRAQRNQALAHLTAGVAHEFNNLLTVIQGNLELMAAGEGPAADLIASTQRAADRGANVTRALQAYARRQSLRPVTGLMKDMLGEVAVLLNSILGQSIRLELSLPEDTWPLHLDWEQFSNALIILAVNGKDAMPRGGSLRIEAENRHLAEPVADLPQGDYVQMTVTDSGQGMPEDTRRHAFDPFYSTKGPGPAIGLGLSTVFGFIQQSHGHIALDSREGQGTTVTLLLPRAAAN